MNKILLPSAMLALMGLTTFAPEAQAQMSLGGCPGAQRNGLPPCCLTFDVPVGGSDQDRTCVGPATQYSFTLYRFGFEDNFGNVSWLGTERVFDAASVSAGEAVGGFVSGAQLSPGTYPYMRPVISQNFTVSADITTHDGRRCTGTVTGYNADEPPEACGPDLINPDYAPDGPHGNCVDSGKSYIRDNQAPLTKTADNAVSLNFAFYTDSGALCTFPAGGSGDATLGVSALMVSITAN